MSLNKKNLQLGDVREEVVVENLTRTQLVMYSGASGDYNPLHTDEIYTTKVAGYPSVFAHGMLSMGLTGKMLTNYVGDGRLTKFGVRFTSQVWPGDTLTATATITKLYKEGEESFADIDVITCNQEGTVVVRGYATAYLDP